MTLTSGAARRRPTRAERTAGAKPRFGFTLLEVLIALSIIGVVAAVSVPALSNRLEAAFADADLAQLESSARLLPVRVATLGTELTLTAQTLRTPLADGRPPLDLPEGWTSEQQKPLVFRRGGTTPGGTLTVREGRGGTRAWRITFLPVTGDIRLEPLP